MVEHTGCFCFFPLFKTAGIESIQLPTYPARVLFRYTLLHTHTYVCIHTLD